MDHFRLYDGVTARLLSCHATTEDAQAASDEHSIRQLLDAKHWVIVEHLTVSSSADGTINVASEITHVGPPEDIEGVRAWLAWLHGHPPVTT